MENKGLIFIPDISGFTRFVNEMEIDHSRHIISELLDVIINANEIGLEISEIEGDAILFYKYGEAPDLQAIYRQVEKMFCDFHRHLLRYDHRKFCHCKACQGAADLTLKVISHYGEFTGYTVKNFNKLIGKDIIVAHQLLKNDIDQHEYWLVTKGLTEGELPANLPNWMNWNQSTKQTEAGEIPFRYAQLSKLKNEMAPDPPLDLEIKNKVNVLHLEREYDVDIISLLHATVDFQTRKRWQVGIRAIDQVSDEKLPRLGTSHRCLLEKGSSILYSSSYSFTPDKIEYGETDDKKRSSTHFVFEKITEHRTKLSFDLFIENNPLKLAFYRLGRRKKTERTFRQSFENLEEFANEVQRDRLAAND
jgi:hypothetical protein